MPGRLTEHQDTGTSSFKKFFRLFMRKVRAYGFYTRIRIVTYSVVAYVNVSKMHTMRQCRNDTLNAIQLLFTPKFVPEMT